jgi:TrmH RNA methyltransferase
MPNRRRSASRTNDPSVDPSVGVSGSRSLRQTSPHGSPKASAAQRQQASPAAATATACHRHCNSDEATYHGLHACEALFARRPESIVRVYLTVAVRQRLGPLIRFCSSSRRGYRLVESESLDRLAGTKHHEGVAILAKAIPRLDAADLFATLQLPQHQTGPWIYLDGISNPHNLGSILRTAAHFGCSGILGRQGELPPLSPAAARVAEGAAEMVPVYELANPRTDLTLLQKAGNRLIATTSHRGTPLQAADLRRRCVLILGSEGSGMTRGLERLADTTVCIPGTGVVESLNVAVACGILLAEACRQPTSVPAHARGG